jgi:hypothetical protein
MPPDNYGSSRRQKGSTANAKIHHAEASARRAQPEVEGNSGAVECGTALDPMTSGDRGEFPGAGSGASSARGYAQ